MRENGNRYRIDWLNELVVRYLFFGFDDSRIKYNCVGQRLARLGAGAHYREPSQTQDLSKPIIHSLIRMPKSNSSEIRQPISQHSASSPSSSPSRCLNCSSPTSTQPSLSISSDHVLLTLPTFTLHSALF